MDAAAAEIVEARPALELALSEAMDCWRELRDSAAESVGKAGSAETMEAMAGSSEVV